MNKKIGVCLLSLLTVFLSACTNENSSQASKNTETLTTKAITTASERTESETTITEETIAETTKAVTETEAAETFPDYQSAYKKIIEENLPESDSNDEYKYNLIYFDNDDIPELVIRKVAWMEMYTYNSRNVYLLLDGPHGAMGINGYLYCPKMNSLKYNDADLAGAVRYTIYAKMNDNFKLEATNEYVAYMFNDANDNYMRDDDEEFYDEPKLYIDEKEITKEEAKAFDVGEYEYISGDMTIDEIYAELEN